MSNQQNDALNAYAAAAELSYLRTDDGIAFAAMPAEAFVDRVEAVMRFHEDWSEEGQVIAVQTAVRDRVLEEICAQGLHAQFQAIDTLLAYIGDAAEDRIGAPAFGAIALVESTLEGLEQFILAQTSEVAA